MRRTQGRGREGLHAGAAQAGRVRNRRASVGRNLASPVLGAQLFFTDGRHRRLAGQGGRAGRERIGQLRLLRRQRPLLLRLGIFRLLRDGDQGSLSGGVHLASYPIRKRPRSTRCRRSKPVSVTSTSSPTSTPAFWSGVITFGWTTQVIPASKVISGSGPAGRLLDPSTGGK